MSAYPRTAKTLLARTFILLLAVILGINGFGLLAPGVSAAASIDLTVQDISISPQDPTIGDAVTITIAVKNQGADGVGINYVGCFIDDTLLDVKDIIAIGPGAVGLVSFNWTAVKGSHVIRAVADYNAAIAETNETNNTRMFNFSILAPDLTIQSVSWSPQNPSKGDNVAFSVIIKNQGTSRSSLTDLFFYVDGISRGSQSIDIINPGETLTRTINWIASDGQHTIRIVVDKDNYVAESDETNNEQTFPFTTLPPDLVVQSVTWTPENPSRNDQVTFIVAVKNQGGGKADSCYLGYFIDDVYVSSISVNAIAAGGTSYLTFTWTALADTHSIKLVIDYSLKVVESDETNNELSALIATSAPDLIVKDITWTPQDAGVGDVVHFTVTIKNQGNGGAGASRAAYHVGGVYRGSLSIPPLDAGEEVTGTFDWTAEYGAITVMVAADSDSALLESHEANNMLTKTVPVIQADLVIDSITWLPVNPAVDETVVFTVSVKNQGGGKASLYHVGFYIDDTLVGSDLVYVTEGGDITDTVFEWQAQNGRHIFKAVADYTKVVTESNEKNNEQSSTIVPFMPDLAVGTVTWSPLDIGDGITVTFDIIVQNLGSIRAGASRLAYYVDGEMTGFTYIGSMDPGSTVTEHFTWVATAGPHRIDIVADANNQILEIDEDNNTKVVSLPPPDLTVLDIGVSPLDVAVGDTVSVIATIKNQGKSVTQPSLATLYVDGALVDSTELPPIGIGASYDVSLDWVTEAGTHTFKITADIDNTVIESDEVNNDKEMKFATLTPDLVVQDFFWETNNELASNEIHCIITVKNAGTGTAGSSQLKYYFEDTPAFTEDMPPILPGETAEYSFSTILSSGAHSAFIIVDYFDDVEELDEDNNQDIFTFDTIVPDLIIRSITWSPLDVKIGDEVTITAKVENQGIAKAVAPRMTLYVDGVEAGYTDIPEIEMDSIVTADFTWTVIAGDHEITVLANSDNLVVESNFSNNAKTRTISFEAPLTPTKVNAGLPDVTGTNKGFLNSWWWVLLLVAALLGVGAFITAMRAAKKKY
ncbi:MAG: CARDB domain-containing protein [Dehalococcoidales bacterium]